VILATEEESLLIHHIFKILLNALDNFVAKIRNCSLEALPYTCDIAGT